MSIKNKYYLWSLSLFAAVFVVWGMFYIYITGLIRSNTQLQLESTADQIANDLGNEFAGMEQLAFTLSQNESVKYFVAEEDITEYFLSAPGIDELLSSSISGRSLIGNVISFNKDGAFYRFRGTTGNTACARILYLLGKTAVPKHIVVHTADSVLLGYGCGIYDVDVSHIGTIVVLADREAILSRVMDYAQNEGMHVSLLTDDKVIVSDSQELLDLSAGDIQSDSYYFTDKRIGMTPFSLLVTADTGYLSASNMYFVAAALVTGLALGFSLLLFAAFIRKQFFKPMLRLLDSVENLDLNYTPGAIPYVHSPEFDKLVIKLNEMLERIEVKNKSIQNAQLQLKDSEIQKQKAINYSLKKQINAHFTVNILNIIKILVSKKELERAAELCDGLSMLVRYAHDEDEFINAWEEFHVLQNYINIMNIRYNNKLEAVFDLDDRLMDLRIPRMLLQPIVENAIVHGYRNCRQGCVIEITADVIKEQIRIIIRDHGEGMSLLELSLLQTQLSSSGADDQTAGGIENIALININRRIAYYYGEDCGLAFNPVVPSGTEVKITLGTCPRNHAASNN
jgi:sensor histidine kinase YesM